MCIPEDCLNCHPNEDLRDQEQRAQRDYEITLPSIDSEILRNQRNWVVTRTRIGRNMGLGSDLALESTQWRKRFHEVIAIRVRKSDYLPELLDWMDKTPFCLDRKGVRMRSYPKNGVQLARNESEMIGFAKRSQLTTKISKPLTLGYEE